MIRCICCLLLVTALSAAAQGSPAFAPIPLQGISWHGDNAPVSEGGIIGKLQLWVFADWEVMDEKTKKRAGRDAYNGLSYQANSNRTSDHRWWFGDFACGGMPAGKKADEVCAFAKGQDGSGGLVRALGGDADAVLVVVGVDGKVERVQRFSGQIQDIITNFDTLVAKAEPLLAGDAEVPAPAKPAAILFKLGDARGGLALAAKKGGPEGQQLIKGVLEKATAKIAALSATLADTTQPAADRFLASEHLIRLIEEFPQAPSVADASKALKATKADATIAKERTAWNALQAYLAQAAKVPAAKIAAFHKQSLPGLRKQIADTYAGTVAMMIAACAHAE
jgi:hypothetical protein